MRKSVMIAAACICAMIAAQAHAMTITAYYSDFDAAAIVAPGVTASLTGGLVQPVQGLAGLGNGGNVFGGSFLSSFDPLFGPTNAATLTLTNLPVHSSINITGLLAAMDTWDSDAGGICCNPDLFQILVDGPVAFQDTYNNIQGDNNNINLLTDIGAGYQERGFNTFGTFPDQAFDLENELANILHSSSTLTITFIGTGDGWEFGDNESWGIDNLLVALNGVADVPEPVTLTLFGAGLLGVGAMRRRGK
ncbi:MAG: PEP-CTERM sorting domain-containing protein [Alphaproteobacteria bacterium]